MVVIRWYCVVCTCSKLLKYNQSVIISIKITHSWLASWCRSVTWYTLYSRLLVTRMKRLSQNWEVLAFWLKNCHLINWVRWLMSRRNGSISYRYSWSTCCLALLIENKTKVHFWQNFTNLIILSGTIKPSGTLLEKLSHS